MTQKYSFIILIIFLTQCNLQQKSSESLNNADKVITDSISFEAEIIRQIRDFTDSAIYCINTQKSVYNSSTQNFDTINLKYKGVSFKVDERKAREVVFSLKDKFLSKGYLIYISESNFGYKPDEITIIKSKNQFDILILEETNGINYGIENDSVIKTLKNWNEQHPFQIIGAGFDYIEAVFIVPPTDIKTFAKKVYEFCPDIVEQGTGTIEKLEEELEMTGVLYLWWD